MLPQSPQALFHYDTVWEEFLESAVAGWKEEAARQKAEEMAAFLELDGKKFSHPYDLSGGEMQRAAVGKLLLQRADPAGARDELLHTMACKSAIKAGMTTDAAELAALVRQVQSGAVRYCPHGRPVAVQLRKYEVEKMFKRA